MADSSFVFHQQHTKIGVHVINDLDGGEEAYYVGPP